MKAIILAAGKGERLSSITQTIPKPMILFKGKPLLQYNIELCRSYEVEEIYINVHHLAGQITDYFGDGSKFGVNIEYSFEEELLGTSGAVKKIVRDYWGNFHESFFVIYGDNYSNYNLNSLKQKANGTNSIVTIAFHYRKDTMHSGVAEFNKNQRILKFIEKPKPGESESHWVNAGIYYLRSDILKYIPDGNSDFAKEIFPKLLEKKIPLYGVLQNIDLLAFDTPEMYTQNIIKLGDN
jgi:NDP-sugar pyrophosphorylase family protein